MTKGKGKGTYLVQNEEKRREYQKREQLRDVLKKKQNAAAVQKASLEKENEQILIEETKMKKASESFRTSNDDTADDDWGDFDFTDEEYKEAEAAQSRNGESSGWTNEVVVGEGSLSLKEVEAAKSRGGIQAHSQSKAAILFLLN